MNKAIYSLLWEADGSQNKEGLISEIYNSLSRITNNVRGVINVETLYSDTVADKFKILTNITVDLTNEFERPYDDISKSAILSTVAIQIKSAIVGDRSVYRLDFFKMSIGTDGWDTTNWTYEDAVKSKDRSGAPDPVTSSAYSMTYTPKKTKKG